jgi:alginate O-acetyltransferase complex protein AlgI
VLFNSVEFFLFFLPVTLGGFALATRSGRPMLAAWWLILASLFFYSWWNWRLLGLLGGSVILNYLVGSLLARHRSPAFLGLCVAANLAAIGWFKYANLLVGTAAELLGKPSPLLDIILPLAISFFTFQQIDYLVDIWRGTKPAQSFAHYALFVVFFPHLVAGPLLHHGEMLPQFADRAIFRVSWNNLAVGLALFTIGLVKKVGLADAVMPYADQVFGNVHAGEKPTLISAWAGAMAFTLQIYFDFSGYSDMAIGIARMFGVRLPINFNSPYQATSIIEFWRRWHITLSRFLRDYLYIPLGGNRLGEGRRLTNLVLVMLLGGLWHGAAWTFVVWGGLHGFYLLVNQGWRGIKAKLGWGDGGIVGRIFASALTLLAVVIAWVFFRAQSFTDATLMLQGMIGLNGFYLPESYAGRLGFLSGWGISFAAPPDIGLYPTASQLLEMIGLLAFCLILPNSQEILAHRAPALDFEGRPARFRLALNSMSGAIFAVFCAAALVVSYAKPQPFIYFEF